MTPFAIAERLRAHARGLRRRRFRTAEEYLEAVDADAREVEAIAADLMRHLDPTPPSIAVFREASTTTRRGRRVVVVRDIKVAA